METANRGRKAGIVVTAALFVVAILLAAPTGVRAATTLTWTGAGGEGGLWSDTGNWDLGQVPANGDTLIFPASSSSLLTTDDIAVSIAQITMSNAYQLYGQPLTLTGPFTVTPGSGQVIISNELLLANDVTLTNGDSSNILLDLGDIVESGGSHALTVAGPGQVDLQGNELYSGGTTVDGTTSGYLFMDGPASTSGVTIPVGGTLGGHGTAGIVDATGGTIAPGNSPGHLTVSSLSFTSSSTYAVELDGTTAGTQYDQTTSNGAVSLGSATLNITFGYTPAVGDSFRIIDKASTGAVTGQFNGLSEGREFLSSGHILRITYAGGDGNDVVLTVLNAFTSTTTLASSLNPSTVGSSVTFTAHVTATNSAPVPTGSVTFLDGATTLATVPLDSSDNAATTTSSLSAGTHTITARYSGDTNFNVSQATLAQVVNAVASPGPSLTVVPVPTTGTPLAPALPLGIGLLLIGALLIAPPVTRRR